MLGTHRLWEGAWREARPVPVREPDAPPRLTTRERLVFKAIVHSYVLTAEPVGSRAVARRYRFGISPATIRNVMMDLEEMGLVEQPHASAGRMPTDLGYRLYVDEIMRPEGLHREELQAIDRELDRAPAEAETMLELATALMGRLSTQLAVAFTSDPWMDHIHFGGTGRVLSQPEFRVSDKVRGLFEALETREPLVRLLSADRPAEPGRVQVSIGAEIPEEAMRSFSVISASYGDGEVTGHVGVIGPTRMRYPRLVSLVCYTAAAVSERLGRMWSGPGRGGQD